MSYNSRLNCRQKKFFNIYFNCFNAEMSKDIKLYEKVFVFFYARLTSISKLTKKLNTLIHAILAIYCDNTVKRNVR